jgi:hypothetical protein
MSLQTDDSYSSDIPTPIYEKPQLEQDSLFKRISTFSALTIFFIGSSANIGYKAVIIPSQVTLIAPPGYKELFNGLVSIPSTFAGLLKKKN